MRLVGPRRAYEVGLANGTLVGLEATKKPLEEAMNIIRDLLEDHAPGIDVELHICPSCGEVVEWQGNDYGYLCTGPVEQRHDDVYAEPAKGRFIPERGA
jgi:hypothetical protein